MKTLELARFLAECNGFKDAEIYIEGEDGLLHEFRIDEVQEEFDGFETFYPRGFKLVRID